MSTWRLVNNPITHLIRGWVSPRTALYIWRKENNFLSLPGFERRTDHSLAQSLYRLCSHRATTVMRTCCADSIKYRKNDILRHAHYLTVLYSLLQSSVSTQYSVNLLKPTGYVMYQQFNIQQLYVLLTLYLCVLYLSENKQRLVHKLIGFYNRDEKCLLRGTNWVFI